MSDLPVGSDMGSQAQFQIGATTDRALAAFRRRWHVFLLLPGIAGLPSALIVWRNVMLADGADAHRTIVQNLHFLRTSDVGPLSNIALILGAILSIVAQAAMFRAAFGAMIGRDEGLLESLRLGTVRFWPLFGTGLLLGLGVTAGLVLLVVPGVVLLTMWFVSTPACVIEEIGPINSLQRSMELTKGNRLRIFGIVLLALLVFLTGYMVSLAVVSVAMPGVQALVVMDYVLQAISTAGFIVLITAIYHDLRTTSDHAVTSADHFVV